MKIRAEKPGEGEVIPALMEKAFETAYVKDGSERAYTQGLRESENYLPQRSLVGLEAEHIMGDGLLSTGFAL